MELPARHSRVIGASDRDPSSATRSLTTEATSTTGSAKQKLLPGVLLWLFEGLSFAAVLIIGVLVARTYLSSAQLTHSASSGVHSGGHALQHANAWANRYLQKGLDHLF